jgi:hypothetical protein
MTEPPQQKLPPPPAIDDRLLWDVAESVYAYPCLSVADELGLFALLDDSPAMPIEIARKLGISQRGTEVLVGVLAAQGFLEHQSDRFTLAEVARIYLLPQSPFYRGPRMRADRANPRHRQILATVCTGKPGEDPWAHHRLDAQQAEQFIQSMETFLPMALAVAERGSFADVSQVLDVAGGSGCYSLALAHRHPHLQATVMELPIVCPITERYIAERGMQDRVHIHAADMFIDAWPAGYDAIFFSNVFHNWSAERCRTLAQRSFASLPIGGRIFLHEMLMNDSHDGPLATALFSVHMFLLAGGKQYSAGELAALLSAAGFVDISVTPTFGYFSLVSARKGSQ